ncbi:MAG: mitochondrial fission ELM1 family protein [Caulobacteraceae bacterium]
MPQRPLIIWAVSDGKAGNANQALGLAEAVGRLTPATIETRRIGWRGIVGRMPAALNPAPLRLLSPDSDPIAPPWPDLWIATGRATLALSMHMKRWSGGRTFVVQTQDPHLPLSRFDLVAPPRHDQLTGDNVFPITGSPHRVTPERLAAEYPAFAAQLDPLPHPRAAVLIGGKSKSFDLSAARATALADGLGRALDAANAALLMTFSRRTPAAAQAILTKRLQGRPGMIWDGEGPNPYFAFLQAADYVAVTEDSTSMVAEAASTGKPVFILEMDGGQGRKQLFHAELAALGAARMFDGAFESWSYPPLRETDRLAEEVLRRMRA